MQKSIDVPQLQEFIHLWQRLANVLSANAEQENKKYDLDIASFEVFFTKFRDSYQQYYAEGHMINVWSIAGVGTDEVRNCQILAWLLDAKGSHGLAQDFCYFFIDYLNTHKGLGAPSQLIEQKSAAYTVKTEVSYLNNDEDQANNRLDIEIEWSDFFIILEVKIDAPQTNDQLTRYTQLGNEKSKIKGIKGDWALLYLTKTGAKPTASIDKQTDEKTIAMLEKVRCLSWHDITTAIQLYIEKRAGNQFIAFILKQYCDHINTFTIRK